MSKDIRHTQIYRIYYKIYFPIKEYDAVRIVDGAINNVISDCFVSFRFVLFEKKNRILNEKFALKLSSATSNRKNHKTINNEYSGISSP